MSPSANLWALPGDGGEGRNFTCINEFAYNPTTVGSGYPSKVDALDVCRGVLGLDDLS